MPWLDGTTTPRVQATLEPGWHDPRNYGAKMDLKVVVSNMTAASATVTGVGGPFLGSNAEVGKLAHVPGAGATLLTRTDGAMSISVSSDANVLTSAGATFTSAHVGKQITVAGAGPAGATLTTRVWGVVSATQVRLSANCSTTVTSATFVISDDLYATVTASTGTTLTLSANSTSAVTNAKVWVGTDDAAAIRTTIATALAAASPQAAPPTIYFPRNFGVASTIEVTSQARFLGTGLGGTSGTLAYGSTVMHALAPNLQGFFRFAFNGSTSSGLGLRGSITSGAAILTDPDGSFTAGDVGKRICVIGAGVQAGSQTRVSLDTTISAFTSATQVTLAANASTTVTDATYSWAGANVIGVNNAFAVERIHLVGASGQRCGIHAIGSTGYELKQVTCSDFVSGIGHFADGMVGNTQNQNIQDCTFNTCRVGFKSHNGNAVCLNGLTMIDGNDNNVGVRPGPGTIGIDCDCLLASGTLIIQAVETGLRCDGGTSDPRVFVSSGRVEGCIKGVQLGGDGTNGGNGNVISIASWSGSSASFSGAQGLVLLAGASYTTFTPGFYVPGDIDMYGGSNAAALATCKVNDPRLLTGQTIWTSPNVTAYDATLTANTLYFTRVDIKEFSTLTGIQLEVGSVAGGNLKVALYNASGTLVAQSNSSAVGASTFVFLLVAFTATVGVAPALYYISMIPDASTTSWIHGNPMVPNSAAAQGAFTIPGTITPPSSTSRSQLPPVMATY